MVSDCHGDFTWLNKKGLQLFRPEETAIIILGDCGFNTNNPIRDNNVKQYANDFGYTIYCVRGNHEVRPSDVPNMKLVWDDCVQGLVYYESDYPNIKYFQDYGIYYIKTRQQEYRTLILSGAYSVDKFYRLQNNMFWYSREQLTEDEMADVERLIAQSGNDFDFVFSHTCPMSMRPVDKFLPMIDQSTVDNTMEEWLEKLQEKIKYQVYLAGHYHVDRRIDSYHYLYFNWIDLLDDVYNDFGRTY